MTNIKEKEIEMLRGRPRFTYRDTLRGMYRLDRKTGKETYIYIGGKGLKRRGGKRGRKRVIY
jgi:hypothetical protein